MSVTIDQIKAECRAVLELASKATPGPWEASTVESVGGASICGDVNSPIRQNRRLVASGTWTNQCDACPQIVRPLPEAECDTNTAFIARTRTLTPKLARATLALIEAMEEREKSLSGSMWSFESAFTNLCATWNQ